MTTDHSPLPWKYESEQYFMLDANDKRICNIDNFNAPLIVRAVNAHDAMREALEGLINWGGGGWMEIGEDGYHCFCRYCDKDYTGRFFDKSMLICENPECRLFKAGAALALASGTKEETK